MDDVERRINEELAQEDADRKAAIERKLSRYDGVGDKASEVHICRVRVGTMDDIRQYAREHQLTMNRATNEILLLGTKAYREGKRFAKPSELFPALTPKSKFEVERTLADHAVRVEASKPPPRMFEL